MPRRRSFGPFWRRAHAGVLLVVPWLLPYPSVARADPTVPGELTNPLIEANGCQLCHTYDNATGHEGQPRYAPFYGWQGSMMANAARDPVFWAGVALADQDHPGETTECIRCHSPRAFLEGRGGATSIDALDPADFDGVTCEACHRMTDQGALGNAQYAIDDVPGLDGLVPRRGPWAYPSPGGGDPPHDWIMDPFTGSAQLCGTCHDVTTPRERLDDDGLPMGTMFNEQRTYSEWAGSAFAQPGDDFRSCVDCHMPAVADKPGCNQFVDQSAHATGGRRHDLVGANRFMVELLRAEYGNSGTGAVNDFFFNQTLERMDELLATAATLELQGPAQVHLGEGLTDLQATVTNETGHKLPTGYSEGRIMWLEVAASYGEQVLWTSGLYVPGMGPQEDPQLRDYQGVAEQYATGTTMHLLLNDHWVEDTRIPPRGLQPNVETDPVGSRYPLQGDGTWPHFDVATYAFDGLTDVQDATPGDPSDDVLDVRVRLLYLVNTPQYVQRLADDNTSNDAGNEVAMLFDTLGGAPPLVLAEQSLSVPIVGFGEPPVESTGAVDDTAGVVDSSGGAQSTGPNPGTTGMGTGSATETEGPGQDDEGGSGCSCTTGAGAGSDRAAWWLLVPLGWRARRRRVGAQARDWARDWIHYWAR
ncbi:multiheme c-type cytochrome [Paraliomyxa miuraensis]|uniref:multiheme c-type cytochrome n=1 Tax=Paraliomyxa miuraensis TaxID=376150 RepID=UPI00225911AB|nr:multiheme c-type cytochrome [Paraliomyxa miuraensis]MCX4241721.1 multiheme c-type cytochrome [Paraliomyxa miuraensis]